MSDLIFKRTLEACLFNQKRGILCAWLTTLIAPAFIVLYVEIILVTFQRKISEKCPFNFFPINSLDNIVSSELTSVNSAIVPTIITGTYLLHKFYIDNPYVFLHNTATRLPGL